MHGTTIQTNIEQIYCSVVTPVAPATKIEEECSSEIHFIYGAITGSCDAITVVGGRMRYKPSAIVVSWMAIAMEKPNSIFVNKGLNIRTTLYMDIDQETEQE